MTIASLREEIRNYGYKKRLEICNDSGTWCVLHKSFSNPLDLKYVYLGGDPVVPGKEWVIACPFKEHAEIVQRELGDEYHIIYLELEPGQ